MDIISLSTTTMILATIVVVIASLLSSLTGSAGGILMFSGMSVFIPLRPLIAIHASIQVVSNGIRAWLLRRDIRWAMCVPFFIGASLGAALTTRLLVELVSDVFALYLLLGLIGYTLFKPKRLPALNIKDKQFFWVGLAAGSLGIIAGAVDPLLTAFFLRDDLSKESIVANKSLMQLWVHLTKIPAFLYLGFSFVDNAGLIVIFSLAALLATKLGVFLLRKVNTGLFLRLMWWALFVSGAQLVYQITSIHLH
ncbi:TSUP family transporter [Vibrio ostreicida]|uniref:Probable membrane transporter protein n=1 Tax=Vibrio ostreicida TaxID=526588 RepID=A0ABT8BUS7_9VIBR|nr:sulfite exporter TauE/SafE family protein [Vibrio ostreicida]MDN3610771.1 sulfite exporter TauE/SafE family protein [Vibrio ostreicida]NPD07234.1 sulfite exporter TauE/SafE family protein [Vibrio ostreicida]